MKRCINCNKILTPWNSKKGGMQVEHKNGVTKEGKYCNKCSKTIARNLILEALYHKKMKEMK